MDQAILVVFDGKAFVPVDPVSVPVGTKALVRVAANQESPFASPPPPPPTAEDNERWERLKKHWAENPSPWATPEEAFGRPRYEP